MESPHDPSAHCRNRVGDGAGDIPGRDSLEAYKAVEGGEGEEEWDGD